VIRRAWITAAAAFLLFSPRSSRGDEVRYYEQDGVTYCETRRTVEPPLVTSNSAVPGGLSTVCREQLVTETQELVRPSWTLVTEYRLEPHWVNRRNPFAEPYVEYRYEPRAHWERRVEVVRVPVVCRRCVPESYGAVPPGASWTGAAGQEVVTRVVVAGNEAHWSVANGPFLPVASPPWVWGGQYGGVARVANEPPPIGPRPAW
jgi:hypothetical protein